MQPPATTTRWLPRLEKKPDPLTLAETDSGFTKGEKTGITCLILGMQLCLTIITGSILYSVAVTDTMLWTYSNALALAIFNLYPTILLSLILFSNKTNYTLCPQGHITTRSSHSRYCYQCGMPLLTRQPL